MNHRPPCALDDRPPGAPFALTVGRPAPPVSISEGPNQGPAEIRPAGWDPAPTQSLPLPGTHSRAEAAHAWVSANRGAGVPGPPPPGSRPSTKPPRPQGGRTRQTPNCFFSSSPAAVAPARFPPGRHQPLGHETHRLGLPTLLGSLTLQRPLLPPVENRLPSRLTRPNLWALAVESPPRFRPLRFFWFVDLVSGCSTAALVAGPPRVPPKNLTSGRALPQFFF